MIGRRTAVGLSLLCALMFSALVVQSASATETAKNTTAFTCVKGGGTDFADAHCDKKETGEFGHVAIAAGTETEVEVTNAKTANKTAEGTSANLKGTLAGTELDITCNKVSNGPAKSFLKNIEPSSKVHDVEGTADTEFTECTVAKPANCTLKTATAVANVRAVENVGAAKRMGLEFTQEEVINEKTGEKEKVPFAKFLLEGEKCALKAAPIEVSGSAIATGAVTPNEPGTKQSGATLVFSPAEEMQALKIGGKTATFTSTVTTSMKAAGNPISLTTVT